MLNNLKANVEVIVEEAKTHPVETVIFVTHVACIALAMGAVGAIVISIANAEKVND